MPSAHAEIYPREHIPKQPVLSGLSFTDYSRSEIPSVLDAGEVLFASRGSMAIGLALQHAQIGNDDEILSPAYHCISMIEPMVWCGARPVFYRIKENTSVDLDDVESRLSSRTRALLVTHYFGFPQDMVRIRSFCDTHRILLIEDCAHAFFGVIDGAPLGSFGDYAIASAWKFFPICDGGLLISRSRKLSGVSLQSRGLRFEAKSLINPIELAFEYRRLNVIHPLFKGPLSIRDKLQRVRRKRRSAQEVVSTPSIGLGGWGFDAALVSKKMSVFSWFVTRTASRNRITRFRRSNYDKLLAALRHLPGCRPLFAILPPNVVPQVFPLVYDEPHLAFPLLKRAGVPIIRFGEYLWERMDAATCPVSNELSRRVFQFPCHQDLDDSELNWMIDKIKSVCGGG